MQQQLVSDIERYVLEAPVLTTFALTITGGGGHVGKFSAALEGGVSLLMKPLCTNHDAGLAEVAAWRVASMLEWNHMLPITVLRPMRCPTHNKIEMVAGQLLMPSYDDHPNASAFSDDDIWHAAIFDEIVCQSDRLTQNWLGVPATSQSQQRLVLIDNGYSFGCGGSARQSIFTNMKVGVEIPEKYKLDIAEFMRRRPHDLTNLIHPKRIAECRDRAQNLLNNGRIQ